MHILIFSGSDHPGGWNDHQHSEYALVLPMGDHLSRVAAAT